MQQNVSGSILSAMEYMVQTDWESSDGLAEKII